VAEVIDYIHCSIAKIQTYLPSPTKASVFLMIVIDCTVIADFFIGTPEFQKSATILLETDPEWISPILWQYEFGNVLRKQVCGGRMLPKVMEEYLVAAEALVMESVTELDSSEVGRLANSNELSFYDASYVWVGMARGLAFHSRDDKLRRKCPEWVQPMPSFDQK